MRKHVLLLAVLSTMSACLLPALPARASLLTKAWVSNTGTDSLICGAITLPCATFQRAHDNVFAGGEIGVLTPGDYGQLAIIKSVNITNDGTGEASVLSGGIGISIGASAGDIIILRGLVIDGQVGGSIGISIGVSSAVHIQNCVIRNFEASGIGQGFGIKMNLGTNTQLFVSDSIIFNNGANAGSGGILIQPTGGGGNANVVLDRVHLENNVIGLIVDGAGGTGNGAHVVVRDSVVSGNFSDGIRATSLAGKAPAFVVVERTSAVNNAGTGLQADGPRATMLLNDDTITRNGTGISAVNGGQLITYGTNLIDNNIGADGTPTGSFTLN